MMKSEELPKKVRRAAIPLTAVDCELDRCSHAQLPLKTAPIRSRPHQSQPTDHCTLDSANMLFSHRPPPPQHTTPQAVFCRCWRSGTFPMCDGAHAKHNKETGARRRRRR